jgi:3-dehydroquinate dehydratase-2
MRPRNGCASASSVPETAFAAAKKGLTPAIWLAIPVNRFKLAGIGIEGKPPGMAQILLLNGPNLNLLGSREPEIYGGTGLADIERQLQVMAQHAGHRLDALQSNSEAELIDRIHAAAGETDFILFNPGGLTHTSVALRDALLAVGIPFIEIHISNVHAREDFRRHSYFADVAVGTIAGLGPLGYELALRAADEYLRRPA